MPPGHLLADRYRLLSELGRGGMSIVWRAYDGVLHRRVAVKVISESVSEELRPLLRREAWAAGRLSHPGIAQVYDYGEVPGPDGAVEAYLVMELVDGVPLDRWLAGGAALPWRRAAAVCGALADALAEVHRLDLVHRDLKPANVLVTARGPKLVDFGICAIVGAPDARDGQLMGTPAYVAPERIADEPVRPASDVYALGMLCYRMITGTLPWPVDSATGLLRSHVYTAPAALPPLPGLPDEVSACLMRTLDKDPAARPTARELADVLLPYAEPGDLSKEPPEARVAPAPGSSVAAAEPDATVAAALAVDTSATGAHSDSTALAVDVPTSGAHTVPAGNAEGDESEESAKNAELAAAAGGLDTTRLHLRSVILGKSGEPARPPRIPHRLRRPLAVLATALAATLILTAAWVGQSDRASEPSAHAATTPACAADFVVQQDSGTGFTAALTVRNEAGALDRWSVTFAFPADQSVSPGTAPAAVTASGQTQQVPVSLSQNGSRVVADAGAQPLPPGATVSLALSGTYAHANPLPTAVSLGGRGCATQVSGATVAPTPTQPTTPPTTGPATGTGTGKGTGTGQDAGPGKDKHHKKGKG
jgi:eukaryotic-like serine/threonine-protein kinase